MASKAAFLITEFSQTFDIEALVQTSLNYCERHFDFFMDNDLEPECTIYAFSDKSVISVFWKIERVRMNATLEESINLLNDSNYGFNPSNHKAH